MSATTYNDRLALRVPASFRPMMAKAAARLFISQAAYVRQALCERLERDGFKAVSDEPETCEIAAPQKSPQAAD